MVSPKQATCFSDQEPISRLIQGRLHVTNNLKRKPRLTICQDIVSAKIKIDQVELKPFLDGVDKLSEAMFCSPTSDTELTQASWKKRMETQMKIFDKL